jgi:transposase
MDDDAPASDAVLALDAPERATRDEESLPVGDAVGQRPSSAHRSSPRPVARRRIGRPTTLTPKLAKKLARLVREMGRVEPAARVCGIPPPTVQEWIARGENRHSQGRPPTRAYAAFAAAIEKALGEWEQDRLRNIRAAGKAKPELWAADGWQLERRWPDRYGRRTAVEHTGTITVMEVRGLLLAMSGVLERYVPVERREAELANLLAEARELGGGGVVALPLPRES